MLNIISILLIILLLFVVINMFINVQENMSMKSNYLNKKLNENGYFIDINNYSIVDKNNDIIKKYDTLYFNSNKSHYIAKNKPLTNNILIYQLLKI